ncbi:MAG: class I SAM-dependent RNA methyltransferase, partial [Anaerolineae bacterium]
MFHLFQRDGALIRGVPSFFLDTLSTHLLPASLPARFSLCPMPQTIILSLETPAYGGETIGRLPPDENGRRKAVFVPYALPGERVRVHLVEEKRGYARAELLEVLMPAPERIPPRCPHFTHCGGCHYQHIPYEAQLHLKTNLLREQLQRIGRIAEPPVQPIVPSPEPWRYRNHVQFHLTADGQLGFRAPRSEEVIPIQKCYLLHPTISEVWPHLEIEPLPGLERVALRVGDDDDLMLMLESHDPQPPEFSVDFPLSAMYLGPQGRNLLAGYPDQQISVLGRTFQVSAGAFFQVNVPVAGQMVTHVLEHLPLDTHTTALDLYCGVGLFSAFLAERVGRLIGVEENPWACEDFTVNLDAFDHVALYEAPVEMALPHLREAHPQVVVLDPPRSGVGRDTLKELLALQAEVIAYIS